MSRASVRTVVASVVISGVAAVSAASWVAHDAASASRSTVNIHQADVTVPLPTDTTLTVPTSVVVTVPVTDTTVPVTDTTTTQPPDTVPVTVTVPASIPIPVTAPVETIPEQRGSPRGGGGFVAHGVPIDPAIQPTAPPPTYLTPVTVANLPPPGDVSHPGRRP